MLVNTKLYGSWGYILETIRLAALANSDRVEDFGCGLLALTDDQDQKWLFWATDEAWDQMIAELGWGEQERNWRGHYSEPSLEEVDQTAYSRQDTYWEWWSQTISPHWDGVLANDLEIACVDQYRPVYTVDGIVRDEDGNEEYHQTCWGTTGVVLRPEAKFWTYDNFQIKEEIVELAENGYICYRVFDLLPESED